MNINVKLKIVITLTRDLLLIHFLLPKLISLFFFNNVPSPLGFVDLELPYNVLYDGSEKGKKKKFLCNFRTSKVPMLCQWQCNESAFKKHSPFYSFVLNRNKLSMFSGVKGDAFSSNSQKTSYHDPTRQPKGSLIISSNSN